MKNQKRLVWLMVLPMALIYMNGNVFGFALGTPYGLSPGEPYHGHSFTYHNGTINTSGMVFGDFLGRSAANPNAIGFGSSGAAVGWDDTWISGVGNANTNGDFLDGLWSQIYSDGGWWDLGTGYSDIAVFSSQDHGPYPAEGIEYYIFGTNTLWDNTSLSAAATITDVYLDGWRVHNRAEDLNGNGWQSDDLSALFQLDNSYRYIKLVAWSSSGSFNEPEIDAVAGTIPEPTTLLLFGLGLTGLAGIRRKFRK
jgi:hypothetical protein